MNNTLKDIDPISEALSHAGESSAVSPTLARMFQRELTPDMQLPPMEFLILMRLFGEPCFPRRELVAITGRAKSGKTFVMSIIMLMGVIDRILQFERDGKEPLKVLWFDTEQSKQSTLDIIQNRIVEMYHRRHQRRGRGAAHHGRDAGVSAGQQLLYHCRAPPEQVG